MGNVQVLCDSFCRSTYTFLEFLPLKSSYREALCVGVILGGLFVFLTSDYTLPWGCLVLKRSSMHLVPLVHQSLLPTWTWKLMQSMPGLWREGLRRHSWGRYDLLFIEITVHLRQKLDYGSWPLSIYLMNVYTSHWRLLPKTVNFDPCQVTQSLVVFV